jgi:uncharacterized membrane protein
MASVTEYPQTKQKVRRAQVTPARLWHVVAVVVTPLTLLVVLVVATLVGTAFARSLTASDGFFVQQQDAMLVVSTGLMLAAAAYTIGIIVALRKISHWHKTSKSREAVGATWGLGMIAVIVSLPLLLAMFIR